eukprot:CAMPEP_0182469150 /NCGR_PEP_ID=MMETSP1319-20130603/16634_1 /TAXON_ID=172717 /ORGANISM="Bolidomonas pacifica, Strain RCC208" /LENGTH=346 /DNA_ID=CAMNT_0024669425 /DNA_START=148 /DNA_END=1184 /DNA_ORIENTATION=+
MADQESNNMPEAHVLRSCSSFGMLSTGFLSDLTTTLPGEGCLALVRSSEPVMGPQHSFSSPDLHGYADGKFKICHVSNDVSKGAGSKGVDEGQVYQIVRKARRGTTMSYLSQFGPTTCLDLTRAPPPDSKVSPTPRIIAVLPHPTIDVFITTPSSTESPVLSLPHRSRVTCMSASADCLFTGQEDGSLRCYVLQAYPIKGRPFSQSTEPYAVLSAGIAKESRDPHFSTLDLPSSVTCLCTSSPGSSVVPSANSTSGLVHVGLSSGAVLTASYGISLPLSPGGGPHAELKSLATVSAGVGVPSCVRAAADAADGGRRLAGCHDGSVLFWPKESGEGPQTLRYGAAPV